jgi:acyl carrier protein
MNSKNSIKTTIARLGNIPVELLDDEQRLADLLVDSFAIVDLSIALQEELSITFTHDDLVDLDTVGQLIALIGMRTANDRKVAGHVPR